MGYATETLTAIPFGRIIGGPLQAVVEAQALAARTTIDFIQAVGFDPPPPEQPDPFAIEETPTVKKPSQVRYVTFSYDVVHTDGTLSKAELKVPILTMIPIPYIRVDEVRIDFTAKILEQTVHKDSSSYESSSSTSNSSSYNWSVGGGWWWWWSWGASGSSSFNATYSNKQSSTSSNASKYQTEYSMNVHVRATQDDMPAGLSKILNILENTIREERKPIQPPTSGS